MTTKLARLPLATLFALITSAAWELACARLLLLWIKPGDLLGRNTVALQITPDPDTRSASEIEAVCGEVAAIVSQLARRVPWRSDCLIQALAGQRLLLRDRIASEIVIGTSKSADDQFEAHAWLACQDRVVLGGDIARFQPLLEPNLSALGLR